MKYKKLLLLFFAAAITSGYTPYFVSDSSKSSEHFYGMLLLRSMYFGTSEMNDLDSDLKCSGMVMVTKSGISSQNIMVSQPGQPFARIKCNDGRILEMIWNANNTLDALDQYGKSYSFKQVNRRVYKKYIKTRKRHEKAEK